MKVVKKIGNGSFADVFLAEMDNKLVALKKPNDTLSKKQAIVFANREVEMLNHFRNSEYILNLIDYKIDDNENYIITELLGDEVYSLVRHYKYNNELIPLPIVKHLCRQILHGLKELKQKDIFHNDLKLENILFTKPLNNIFKISKSKFIKKQSSSSDKKTHLEKYYGVLQELLLINTKVKITDLGGSYTKQMSIDYEEEFSYSRPTRHYISPERLVNAPVWVEADMWAFGCIVYELITNDMLFNPERNNNMGINSAHIALICKFLGPFPTKLIIYGKRSSKYFINFVHKFQYLSDKKIIPLKKLLRVPKKNIPEIIKFLTPILQIDDKKRISPLKCLDSNFCQKDSIY